MKEFIGKTHASKVCIAKWEKRLDKIKKWKDKYGDLYYTSYSEAIATHQELIRDLKRLHSTGMVKIIQPERKKK